MKKSNLSGNLTGSNSVKLFNFPIKSSFHFFLWTCHVPKAKVDVGIA